MDNVKVVEIANANGDLVEYAVIENEDGGFTSMLKTEYDRQQAELNN